MAHTAKVPMQTTTPRGLALTLIASTSAPFQYDVRRKDDGLVLGQVAGYADYGWREYRDGAPCGPVYLTPAEAADATDAAYQSHDSEGPTA